MRLFLYGEWQAIRGKVVKGNRNNYKIETGFSDIDNNINYRTGREGDLAAAVLWAKEKGTIKETEQEFRPNEKCTKRDFIDFLSALAEVSEDLAERSSEEITRKDAIILLYKVANEGSEAK